MDDETTPPANETPAPAAPPSDQSPAPARSTAQQIALAMEKARLEERTRMQPMVDRAEARREAAENKVAALEARIQLLESRNPPASGNDPAPAASGQYENTINELRGMISALREENASVVASLRGEIERERRLAAEREAGTGLIEEMVTATDPTLAEHQIAQSRAAYDRIAGPLLQRIQALEAQVANRNTPPAPPTPSNNPNGANTPSTPPKSTPTPVSPLGDLGGPFNVNDPGLREKLRKMSPAEYAKHRAAIKKAVSASAPANPFLG